MLNNKGFSLVEVLVSLVVISLVSIIVINYSVDTFSIGKNEAYEMMKKNIYKASESYIRECDNNLLDCNLEWVNNKVEFRALVLKNSGYFDNLVSPIDGKDVGSCLLVRAIKNNGVLDIKIIDNCY